MWLAAQRPLAFPCATCRPTPTPRAPVLEQVAAGASLAGGLALQAAHTAKDGAIKLVFALVAEEGGASGTVETVLIPMTHGRQGQSQRYTACLSTQARAHLPMAPPPVCVRAHAPPASVCVRVRAR